MDPAVLVNAREISRARSRYLLQVSYVCIILLKTHPRHGNSELTWIARRASEFTSPDADAADTDAAAADAACPIRIMKPRTCGISRTALRLLHRANSKFLVHLSPSDAPKTRLPVSSIRPNISTGARSTASDVHICIYRERHRTIVE